MHSLMQAMQPPSQPPPGLETAESRLEEGHLAALRLAVANVLQTEVAEFTYGQIIDGLPTTDCFAQFRIPWFNTHPAYTLNHAGLCEGSVARAREIRSKFDPGKLRFRTALLDAFQSTPVDSEAFDLRLFEMIAVACHAIAVFLYQQDDGSGKHPRRLHEDWREEELQFYHLTGTFRFGSPPPLAAFAHRSYQNVEKYPDDLADVVGYWAEAMIFGGVVVFDRGESEVDCKAVYLHDGRRDGPMTLYPPTEEQFQSLKSFLRRAPRPATVLGPASPPEAPGRSGQAVDETPVDSSSSPLPMLATKLNRYRWDPCLAFRDHHIFRDRYERTAEAGGRSDRRWGWRDWPEKEDQDILVRQLVGGAVDPETGARRFPLDEEVEAAKLRLKQITPTSPCWVDPEKARKAAAITLL